MRPEIAFHREWGIRQAEAQVLATLYRANCTLPAATIMASVGRSHRPECLQPHVRALRKVLGSESVINDRGRGWRLSPAMRTRCWKVLNAGRYAAS